MQKSCRIAVAAILMLALVLALGGGTVVGQVPATPGAESRGSLEDDLEHLARARVHSQRELSEAKAQLESIQQTIQNGNDPPQVNMMLRADRDLGQLRDTCKAYQDGLESLSIKYGGNSPTVREYTVRRAAAQERFSTEEARLRATYRKQIVDAQSSVIASLASQEISLASQIKLLTEMRERLAGRPLSVTMLKDLSPEQQRKIEEINKRRDAEIQQVLTDQQRKQLLPNP